MKFLIRPCAAALLGTCLLFGCSQSDAASTPTIGPCALLFDVEVSKAFPGATSGKRNRGLDGHGILTCIWDTPTDRFVVQVFVFEAESGSVADELRSRVSGSIDPTLTGASSHVHYQTIDGIGDEAMLVLEKADPKIGILADTAVLVMQRGNRRAVWFTGSSLAAGDRVSALETFEGLGRHVAQRP